MTIRQKEILQDIGMLILAMPIFIIILCIFLMIFSAVLDAVTGIDIIRNYIRPFFGN